MIIDSSAKTRRCGWLLLLIALVIIAGGFIVSGIVLAFMNIKENWPYTMALVALGTGLLPYAFITKNKPSSTDVTASPPSSPSQLDSDLTESAVITKIPKNKDLTASADK